MKIGYLLLLPALATLCVSCNNSSPEGTASTGTDGVTDSSTLTSTPVSALPVTDSLTTTPLTVTPVPATTGMSASANPSGAKLNPPHGEPGHRCEIPVGAPLDSKPPATGASPADGAPAAGSGTPINVSPTSQPAATPAGMNPPHGQPGHDCNIPVGSPLKK